MQRRGFRVKIITCSAFDRAFAARAQRPTMPVLGFLSSRSPGRNLRVAVAAFVKGFGKLDLSTDKISGSSFAGRKASMTRCQA